MRIIKLSFFIFLLISCMTSCVSKKDYQLLEQSKNEYLRQVDRLRIETETCEASKQTLENQIDALKVQIKDDGNTVVDYQNQVIELEKELEVAKNSRSTLEQNNQQLINQLESLSIINQQGAANISKSLETLNQQSSYIRLLNNKIQNRDSLNLLLANTIKRSLSDINDTDIEVEVEKGVVFVSISDKVLFGSGQYSLKPEAKTVLSKIALIANDYQELDILVEGHTDNVPVTGSSLMRDNWDLSALRATSVVRSLQREHSVNPSRMTAGARSEYLPKTSNSSESGRSLNRRTKIFLLPKLDQFFELVEESVTNP